MPYILNRNSPDIKQIDGISSVTAISSKPDGGSAKALGSDSTVLVTSNSGISSQDKYGAQVYSSINLGAVSWGSNEVASDVSDVNGFLQFVMKNNHGLKVGDIINSVRAFNDDLNGPQIVTKIINSTTFSTNKATYGLTYFPGVIQKAIGTIGNQSAGNYSIKRVVSDIHGVEDIKLSSGSSDFGYDKVHGRNALRTSRTATAIRQGSWNIYSGKFSNDVIVVDDVTGEPVFAEDDSIRNDITNQGNLGEFTFRNSTSKLSTRSDYGDSSDSITTFYVSPQGNNSYDGTFEQPFLTIEAARDKVRTLKPLKKDVKVILRGGHYPVTSKIIFDNRDSGTDRHKITYTNYSDETPTLTSNVAITGTWVQDSGNRYYVDLPGQPTFQTLIVNGTKANRARFPKDGNYHIMKVYPNDMDFRVYDHFISDTGVNPIPPGIVSGEAEVVVYSNFMTQKMVFSNVVSGDMIFSTVPSDSTAGYNRFKHYNRFYWENSKSFVTNDGDFFYDTTGERLYYYQRSGEGEDITNVIAEIPALQTILSVSGELANIPELNDDFSFSTWFRSGYTATGEWERSIIQNVLAPGEGFAVSLMSSESIGITGFIHVEANNSSVIDATGLAGLNDNSWHHLGVDFDYTNLNGKIFVDGSEIISKSLVDNAKAVTTNLWVGSQGGGLWSGKPSGEAMYWDGELDELFIASNLISNDAAATKLMEYDYDDANIVFSLMFNNDFKFTGDSIEAFEYRQMWRHGGLGILYNSQAQFIDGGINHNPCASFDGLSDHIELDNMPGTRTNNLIFQNLTFNGSDGPATNDGFSIDAGLYHPEVLGVLDLKYCKKIVIDNCTFINGGNTAIIGDIAQYITLINNTITNMGYCGIILSGTDVVVASDPWNGHKINNNHIYNLGKAFKGDGNAIWTINLDETQINNNLIYEIARGGIKVNNNVGNSLDMKWGNLEVAYNRVRDCGKEVYDIAGITVNGVYTQGVSRLHHNHVKDMLFIPSRHGIMRTDEDSSWDAGQVRGMYLDSGSSGWRIEYNVIRRCSAECIFWHRAAPDIIMRNNIFAEPLGSGASCFSQNMAGNEGNYKEAYEHSDEVAFILSTGNNDLIVENNIYYIPEGTGQVTWRLDVPNPTRDDLLKTIGFAKQKSNLLSNNRMSVRNTGLDPGISPQYDAQHAVDTYNAEVNFVTGDPQFVDYANNNFHVLPTSPIIPLGFKNFDVPQF